MLTTQCKCDLNGIYHHSKSRNTLPRSEIMLLPLSALCTAISGNLRRRFESRPNYPHNIFFSRLPHSLQMMEQYFKLAQPLHCKPFPVHQCHKRCTECAHNVASLDGRIASSNSACSLPYLALQEQASINRSQSAFFSQHVPCHLNECCLFCYGKLYRSAGKPLARPGKKEATATEHFEFHIPYL
jgi:hypothetical protein